jgi:Zn-dependent M28 family amino/carboxypeptidase
MKRQLISFFLLTSFVFCVSAQKAQTQKSGADEKNLRTHVEYLASDKLEGRRTGETGATYTAGYISNLFANYKLKASFNSTANGKTKGNYLQKFPFVTGVEIADRGNTFSVDVSKNNEQKMSYLEETAFKPVGFSPNGQIDSRAVVFAGYGIASNELKYDDYANLDVRNKIVVVLDGNADNDSPHSGFARYDAHAKAKIAKDKGAVGLLLITREAKLENDKLAQIKYDATLGEAALPTILISRKSGADILNTDEKGLKQIETIAAMSVGQSLNSCLAANSNASVDFRVNLIKKEAEAYNVVGILEGNDSTLKNEAIVIGAHYDHLGKGGQGSLAANSKEIHHGADDNASGVSAMLELARQFAKEKKNKRTIIFIAFGGEEEGLLGSQFYVNNPAFPLVKTVAMINMDMIGRLNENKLTIGGIGTAGEWKNLIESTNGNSNLLQTANSPTDNTTKSVIEDALKKKGFNGVAVDINSDKFPVLRGTIPKGKMAEAVATAQEANKGKPVENQLIESGNLKLRYEEIALTSSFVLALSDDGFGPSDHSSFYGKQIPVLFFFTGTHNDYHKPTDTAEKINYDGLLKITNFVEEIVKAIDANPTKPTYAVAKSSGMAGGRMGFNVSLGTIPNYADGAGDGLLLDGVRDDSPAAKAGIKAGDKIIKLAGKEIRNVSDYTVVLGELKAGTEYEIVVRRNAENLTRKIIPAARK